MTGIMNIGWCKDVNACDDFVLSVYENFTIYKVLELLLPTGLLIDKSIQFEGSFENYVFLKGNKDEVYSKQEIEFISEIGNVFIFRDFFKKTRKGLIPCRVLAVKSTRPDSTSFSIAFTQIANKAIDGFNICLIISEDGLVFTCRKYEGDSVSKYHISEVIRTEQQMEEMIDGLIFSTDYADFIDYYACLRDSIKYRIVSQDYASKLKRANKIPYKYIEELQAIEAETGLSFAGEIERAFWGKSDDWQESYDQHVIECEELLFPIRSSRVNTMEMLFEAEEMEQMAEQNEQKNEDLMSRPIPTSEERKLNDADDISIALLKDPAAIIKVLKKKRGL